MELYVFHLDLASKIPSLEEIIRIPSVSLVSSNSVILVVFPPLSEVNTQESFSIFILIQADNYFY